MPRTTRRVCALRNQLADLVLQEIIEVILCPTFASWILPLTFAEGYIAIVYLLYVEMLGHSGIRAYWPHPLLTPILKPFDMELAVEDHDLQCVCLKPKCLFDARTATAAAAAARTTASRRKSIDSSPRPWLIACRRIWDKLGNSVGERVECTPDVINPAYYASSFAGWARQFKEYMAQDAVKPSQASRD